MQRRILIASLVATAGLVGWALWPAGEHAIASNATCEERCLARDAACAVVADAQGGWPAADDPDQASKCNGLCFVLRRTATGADAACLR